MRISSVNNISNRNLYDLSNELLKSNKKDTNLEKDDKDKYNKNVVGKPNNNLNNESKEESQAKEVITSKIVTNSNGIRALLMLRNSKVFSSLAIGQTNNMLEEPGKENSDENVNDSAAEDISADMTQTV